MISHVLAYSGGALLTLATAPQLYQNVVSANSDGISWGLIICNTGGLACYLSYAVIKDLLEMTISLAASLALMTGLGFLKCYHSRKRTTTTSDGLLV